MGFNSGFKGLKVYRIAFDHSIKPLLRGRDGIKMDVKKQQYQGLGRTGINAGPISTPWGWIKPFE